MVGSICQAPIALIGLLMQSCLNLAPLGADLLCCCHWCMLYDLCHAGLTLFRRSCYDRRGWIDDVGHLGRFAGGSSCPAEGSLSVFLQVVLP